MIRLASTGCGVQENPHDMPDGAAATLDPAAIVDLLRRTVVRDHMTLERAIECQFELVDAVQAVMGSDVALVEDYGQERSLATVEFGGGGRPTATAHVEQVLTRFFGVEDAVLVHGAGTGAIRAMLNAALRPGARLALHSAPPYKTALPAMKHMGLELQRVDFNVEEDLHALGDIRPHGLYVQHVPQQLGDRYDPAGVIRVAREVCGDELLVLMDENYAVMRSPRIGAQLGADAGAFSLFKLMARSAIGCVAGRADITSAIRRDLSSAGCQVQGPDAMEALRSLMYAPVALAVQNRVVVEVADRINELVAAGELPFVRSAMPAQPAIRCVVLVFDLPLAEEFLRAAWRHGSPSRSVGEEARVEIVPLFTYLTRTFLKGTPGLERYAIRINPMRGGPDAVLRVLRAALEDEEWRAAASAAGSFRS
jgi:hypothetical protein